MKTISIATAAVLASLVSMQAGSAQTSTTTTTTTTWSNDQGTQLNQSWTTQKYAAVSAPDMQLSEGTVVPGTVTFYPLPEAITIPDRDRYEYSVINNHPVVVEKTTRKIVHVWNQ